MLKEVQQFNIGGVQIFVAAFDETVAIQPVLPVIRQHAIEECNDVHTKRQRYCVWLLLDYALRRCIGKGVDELAFAVDDNGKWSCDGGVSFSLSHCKNVVAVAIFESAVGIDVESLSERRFNSRLAERILTVNERANYDILPIDERARVLAEIWTKKESLFKRDGGKSFAPSAIDTTISKTFTHRLTIENGTVVFSVAM